MKNKIPDYITWKILKSGTILLNVNNGNYYTLNPTASDIWDTVIAQKNREDIVSTLCDLYDCSSEQAEIDVEKTLDFLMTEGLLENYEETKIKSEGGFNEKRGKKN